MRSGVWLNPDAFSCDPIMGTSPTQWNILLPHKDPRKNLTWQWLDGEGEQWQFCRKTTSDFLSIPPPFTLIVSPTSCTRSGVMHDDGYKNGAIWVSRDCGVTWKWERLTRYAFDVFLYAGCRAEKLGWFKACLVYAGIRAGGWYRWNKYRKVKP